MIDQMKEEIAKLFKSGFYDGHESDVEITENKDGSLTIEVTEMYEQPVAIHGLLETLQAISRITGKPEVDEGYSISERGCETCDYGSRYGLTFRAFGK